MAEALLLPNTSGSLPVAQSRFQPETPSRFQPDLKSLVRVLPFSRAPGHVASRWPCQVPIDQANDQTEAGLPPSEANNSRGKTKSELFFVMGVTARHNLVVPLFIPLALGRLGGWQIFAHTAAGRKDHYQQGAAPWPTHLSFLTSSICQQKL